MAGGEFVSYGQMTMICSRFPSYSYLLELKYSLQLIKFFQSTLSYISMLVNYILYYIFFSFDSILGSY